MKGAIRKLFLIELHRLWPIAAYFVPVMLASLSVLMTFATGRMQRQYNVAQQAIMLNLNFVVPLASAIFAIGSVSNDVKDGWLRTLLIRPITRQRYMAVKLAAVYCSLVITIVVAGILPNVAFAVFFSKTPVQFDLARVLYIHALILLQGFLYVVILLFLSCWLPGVFNVIALTFWAILASSISSYIQYVHWMDKWLVILKEYLFPSGFWDSIDVVMARTGTPVAELSWGFGALAIFLALAFWSISVIQVDKGSE
ncbi:MAG: ABC transporter permease [Ignavibacteriales bacterium]|nr:ABC transporter permease [Ignavibacteriales bacterium]